MRVGVMVSYGSTIRTVRGIHVAVEAQVGTSGLLLHPGIEFVGIVEPDTSGRGPVERTLREYELVGGLVAADDVEGLMTLDVILWGIAVHTTLAIAAAVARVVRGGVGLLNEWWIGDETMGRENLDVRDLMLAASPLYHFHTTPRCGIWTRATVLEEHPLLPGLRAGATFDTNGCGVVYRPTEGTRVVIAKDRVATPAEHGILGLGDARMPVCAFGRLGEGRVMLAHVNRHSLLAEQLPATPPIDYLRDVIAWLAEPRRERVG